MSVNITDNAKVLSTRLVETLIIGGVVLYGVVQVLNHQTETIMKTQTAIVDKVEKIGLEQARRTVLVDEAYSHIHDREAHQ